MNTLNYGITSQARVATFPSKTGLVSYYKLDNANDSHGTNHGTGVTSMTYTTGKLGNCGVFNNSQRIVVNDTPSLNLSTSFTICAWVNLTNFTGSTNGVYDFIVQKGSFPYNYRLQSEGTGGFTFAVGVGGTNRTVTVDGHKINTWYHLLGIYDSSFGLKFYINSNLVGVNQNTGTITNNTVGLGIGGYSAAATLNSHGNVDEVGIWNRILTNVEIEDLYNQGIGITYS